MPVYNPPLDDIRFVLNDVLKAGNLNKTIVAYADADWKTVSDLLDAVADYSRDVAFPPNQSGDRSANPQCGMDMPLYLNVAASEMLAATRFPLSSYPGLTGSAYDARLKVAMRGLGLSEIAWQNAATYSAGHVQGKALKDFDKADAKAIPLINHANTRRHLMDMKAQIDGFRALAYDVAIKLDLAAKHPEPTIRREAEEYASLMIPVLKSCMTDMSCAIAQRGIQMRGGTGFINETGVNQYYRDAVSGTIDEGSNDIQATDFTFRKVLEFNDHMNRLGLFMQPLIAQIDRAEKNPETSGQVKIMREAVRTFQNTCTAFMQLGMAGKFDEIHAQADHFINMTGRLAVGGMWLKMDEVAREKLAALPENDTSREFYTTKLALADHYFTHVMRPDMKRLELLIEAGAAFLGTISREQQVPAPDRGIARAESPPDNKPHGPFLSL